MTRNGQLRSGGTEAEWARLDQTLTDVRAAFADLAATDVEDLVDQALIDTRRSIHGAPSPQRDEGR